MKRHMVCLFDKQAGMYHAPVLVPKLGVAYRNIQDEVARGGENNPLADHPGDFQLWVVGIFDDDSGEISVDRQLICEVSSLVPDRKSEA